MAKYYYEGNLNEPVNYRKKGTVEYYIRGTIEVEGRKFERYGIKTHFIEPGEDYGGLMERYVLPFAEEGDIVSVSEKIVSMCQGNIVHMEDVKVHWLTRLMSRFGKRTDSGIGITEPYKLQLMIDMNGWGKVLWAGMAGLLGKLVGRRGIFYKILGEETAGIDGFYGHSAFELYHTTAMLNPRDPAGVCEGIYKKYGIVSMIVDANDIDVNLLGKCGELGDRSDESLAALIEDNPAGQDDEQTPFVVIRDITSKAPQPYTPKAPLSNLYSCPKTFASENVSWNQRAIL